MSGILRLVNQPPESPTPRMDKIENTDGGVERNKYFLPIADESGVGDVVFIKNVPPERKEG